MGYRGHVRDGVVVLDDPVTLPDGTEVEVEPKGIPVKTLAERFRAIIGATSELPEDMAENHDHYLHGMPKR